MKVHGLVLVGVRTSEFDRTLEFFRDVLGVPLTVAGEGFGWSKMPNTSKLRAAGVELLGNVGGTAEEGWLHFRAPDGNVYGLTSSESYRR
jgi:catechol 2,3-dioxygenase-like lactoylglutathione lyase family enzyme